MATLISDLKFSGKLSTLNVLSAQFKDDTEQKLALSQAKTVGDPPTYTPSASCVTASAKPKDQRTVDEADTIAADIASVRYPYLADGIEAVHSGIGLRAQVEADVTSGYSGRSSSTIAQAREARLLEIANSIPELKFTVSVILFLWNGKYSSLDRLSKLDTTKFSAENRIKLGQGNLLFSKIREKLSFMSSRQFKAKATADKTKYWTDTRDELLKLPQSVVCLGMSPDDLPLPESIKIQAERKRATDAAARKTARDNAEKAVVDWLNANLVAIIAADESNTTSALRPVNRAKEALLSVEP